MRFIIFSFLMALSLFADDITVTIVYGGNTPDRVVETTYQDGQTALEILQKVADVKTAEGKYKFIRSIDGKKALKGIYGWFYFIDGESAKQMAQSYKLHDNMSMTWLYKVEDCR